ncbi:MAG: pilin [Gammaproteobacteria bacterium]|nr:pilin [Gammaproteobacteria bacterium]
MRAKIADALNVAASMKVLIGEYYITEAKLPKDAAAAGIDETLTSDYVSDIDYESKPEDGDPTAGLLKLTLNSDIGGTAGSKVLQLKATIRNNIVKWKCGPDEDAENASDKLASKYLPSQCR